MIRKTMLGLFTVLSIGLLLPAYADNMTPLQQYNSGTPIDEIQCDTDKILMESKSGKPYCLSENTAIKLADRGFSVVVLKEIISMNENVELSKTVWNSKDFASLNSNENGVNTPATIPNSLFPRIATEIPSQVRVGEEFIVTVHLDYSPQTSSGHVFEFNPFVPSAKIGFQMPKQLELISTDYNIISQGQRTADDWYGQARYGYQILPSHNGEDIRDIELVFRINEPLLYDDEELRIAGGIGDVRVTWYLSSTDDVLTISPHPLFASGSDDSKFPDKDKKPIFEKKPKKWVPGTGPVYSNLNALSPEIQASVKKYFMHNYNMTAPQSNDSGWSPEAEASYQAWLESIKQTSLGVSGQAAPPQVFIHGRISFTDNDEDNSRGEYLQICLHDLNLRNDTFTLINDISNDPACSVVGTDGGFGFGVFNNDPNDNTTLDPVLMLRLSSDAVDVGGPLTVPYVYIADEGNENVDSSIPFNFGIIAVDDANQNTVGFIQAYDVYRELNISHARFEQISNISLDKVLVHADIVDRDDDELNMRAFYHPTNNSITFGQTQVLEIEILDTVDHEYGHHAMDVIYNDAGGSFPDYTCPRHHMSRANTTTCAWGEGFASFFALALNDSPIYQITREVNYNIETRTTNDTLHFIDNDLFHDEATVEGNVAAALWDIYDTRNEAGDNINGARTQFWTTFTDRIETTDDDSTANTIFDFKDDWDDNRYESLDSILQLNTILDATPIIPPTPPTNTNAVTTLSDDFQSDLSKWILTGNSNWIIDDPDEDVPGESRNRNDVLASSNCDDSCIATLQNSLDTRNPLIITFDRFVDDRVDINEGLFVEYSTDGNTWTELASYTENNEQDTERWTDTILALDITESSASLRFVAKSTVTNEHIEIDNLEIVPLAPDVISFDAVLFGDKSRIILTFDERIDTEFSVDDFTISHGSILSVSNYENSAIRYLHTGGIPYDTAITVTYVGTTQNLGGDNSIKSDTSSITNQIPRPTDPSPTDSSPRINRISDVTLSHTETRDISVIATDAENDDITFSLSAPIFVTISDSVNGRATISINPDSSNVGTHPISLTATANGLSNTENFRVIINNPVDITPPVITIPSDKTFEATAILTPLTDSQIGIGTATDNMDSPPTITHNAPTSFPVGITIITYTATDDSDNSASATQRITIQDTTPPTITAPANITLEATGMLSMLDLGNPTVSDLVDAAPTVTSNAPASFPVGITTITYTATDDSGNTVTDTQTITIQDTTPPTITAPANITLEATGMLSMLDLGNPTVSDLVDPTPTVTSNAPASFPVGITTITYTATDDSGNTATATQRITIQDTSSSTIILPADITAEATSVLTVLDIGTVSTTDNVDYTITNDAPTSFQLGTTIVTWSVSDSSGITISDTQTITILDTTSPMLSVPGYIPIHPTVTPARLNIGTATATDLVDSDVEITNNAPATYPLGNTRVTWTATDDAGNITTGTQTISIRPPFISGTPVPVTSPDFNIVTEIGLCDTITYTNPPPGPPYDGTRWFIQTYTPTGIGFSYLERATHTITLDYYYLEVGDRIQFGLEVARPFEYSSLVSYSVLITEDNCGT